MGDSQQLNDSLPPDGHLEIMSYDAFKQFITSSTEEDFFEVMRVILPTVDHLIRKGVKEDNIWVWIGDQNAEYRGRPSVWHTAYCVQSADVGMRKNLD